MKIKNSFIYSFKHSIPIMIGFFPVGIIYGLLMQTNGYNFLWTGACSMFVFAGSLQYLMIDFFVGSTSYFNIAIMAILLNSRHIFYGIPFIEKWNKYGPLKYLLIFLLPDEAFSLDISSSVSEDMDEKYVYLFNGILTFTYWIMFTVLGALVGSLINFNTEGMDFALTALFAVIVVEQFKSSKSALPGIVAAVSSVLCILIFGQGYFIMPSLILSIIALILLRPRLGKLYDD